jgi:hypothetical protein
MRGDKKKPWSNARMSIFASASALLRHWNTEARHAQNSGATPVKNSPQAARFSAQIG